MAYADPTRVERHIKFILNAATTWAGAVEKAIYNDDAITQARVESGLEILRAVAQNPQSPHFGALSALVTVTHDDFLPDHDGEPGVPVIVPFAGGEPGEGVPADPDEIDSWREDAGGVYSDVLGTGAVAHDEADGEGRPAPVSRRYSIVSGRLKFTGHSAQIPLVQLTRQKADEEVPLAYEPTLVKLSVGKLVKEGDRLVGLYGLYAQAGQQDLVEIAGGAPAVSPVPDVAAAQKAGVT